MSSKRVVLNLAGDLSEELSSLVKVSELSIVSSAEELRDSNLAYIFIKSHMGSFARYNDLYGTLAKNIPIIALSDVENKMDFLGYNGKGIINESFLKTKSAAKIVERMLSKKSSLKIENAYEDIFKEFKTIKIDSHESIGFYADLLSRESDGKGFDSLAIRNYFVSVVSYLANLKRFKLVDLPYDVEYGENQNEFLVQIFAKATNFVSDHVNNSFDSGNSSEMHKFLLKMCSAMANVFDIYFLKSSSKIVLTAVWLDRRVVNKSNYYPMLLVNNIDSFGQIRKEWDEVKTTPQVAIDAVKEKIKEKMSAGEVSTGRLDLAISSALWIAKFPMLLKKIVKYIQDCRSKEVYSKDINAITEKDIAGYLVDYPQEKVVKKLTSGDYELILRALVNPEIITSIEESLAQTEEKIAEDQIVRGQYFDSVSKTFEQIDIDGVNELLQSGKVIVKGQREVLKDEIIRIHGDPKDGRIDESIIRVHGGRETVSDLADGAGDDIDVEDIIYLTDHGYEINEKIWNEKRGLLVAEVEAQARAAKDRGATVEEIRSDMLEIFSKILDVDNDTAAILIDGVFENAKGLFANEKMFAELQQIANTYSAEINELRLREELAKKSVQISNLSKVVDALKIENNSLKQSNAALGAGANDGDKNLLEELELANKKIQGRDLVIERLKQSTHQNVAAREGEMEQLRAQLDELLKDRLERGSALDLNEYKRIVEENNTYRGLIEVSNNQIAQLNESLEKLKKQTTVPGEGDVFKAKDSYMLAVQQLDNQKKENEKLRERLKRLEDKFHFIKNKMSSEGIGSREIVIEQAGVGDSEKSALIARLESAQSMANQRLKEQSLKIKELSQKIVYLESGAVVGNNAAASAINAQEAKEAANKSSDYKIKQLEILNEKLVRASAKTQGDLMASKKEVMVLRSENGAYKNNLQSLEKKLEKYKNLIDDYEARNKRH